MPRGTSFVDRGLVRAVIAALGDAPVRLKLWDGSVFGSSAAPACGSVVAGDRRSLLELVLAPGLAFGDGYTGGRIEVEGELLKLLEGLALATPSRTTTSRGPARTSTATTRRVGRHDFR